MHRWSLAVRTATGLVGLLMVGCVPSVETVDPLTRSTAPAVTSTTAAMAAGTPMREVETVTFTIVYDNNVYDSALQTAWGFACLVQMEESTVLFDTGGDSSTLLANMASLGLDAQAIDVVVLSHIHGDHTDGLEGLLDTGARPTVYVPGAFPASFKDAVRTRTDLVEVTDPMEILPGVYTTGEVGSRIVEQALAVETGQGLVVVTGCAHPGIVEMVRRAQETTGGEVALVMGGFHLGEASRGRIERIIDDFHRLGVQTVAPCHCTGDRAREMFTEAFGEDCALAGAGWAITMGAGEEGPE